MAADDTRRHVPVRTCIGCRTRRPQPELWRLAADGNGRVVWDVQRTVNGRGAWVCPSRRCLKEALKKGKLNRALRRPVETDEVEIEKTPWEK